MNMCDHYDGWTAFYEIQQQNAEMYLDLGLTLYKLGEDARNITERLLPGGGRPYRAPPYPP